MSQTSYSIDNPLAFAGLKADAGFDRVESLLAQNAIAFGLGLVSGDNAVTQVRSPILNKSTLSIDADLIASNSTIVTVNGNATTATVFATDHETTMAAIAAKVAVLAGVLSATYAGTGRDIVVVGDNVLVSSSAVTTLGASQGTWTQVQATNDIFRGVSLHQHVEKVLLTGVAQYLDEEAVSVLRQGSVWMMQETSDIGTLAIDTAVYSNVVIQGAELGRVTSVSTGNVLIPTGVCRQLSTDPDGNGIALIEINLP